MTKPLDDQVAQLDSAIEKAAPLPENRIAWRLLDSALVHAHQRRLVGTVLRDLGFIDLTFLEEVARGYVRGDHPVLAQVRLPAGAKVLPMFQVIDSEQGDLLVARGSYLVVRGVGAAEDGDLLPMVLELVV